MRASEHRWLGALLFHWCNYQRARGRDLALVGFPRYLARPWEVDSVGALVVGAARRAAVRVGAALRGRSVPSRSA